MKRVARCASVLAVWVLTQSGVLAQIDARINLDHTQFLLYEPVTGDLVLRNVSGRRLVIQPEQFHFVAKFDQNRPLPRLDKLPVSQPIHLAPGQTVTNRINFSESFRIRDQGPYTIGGRLSFLGRVFNMPYAYTDVVPGIKIMQLQTVAGDAENSSLRNLNLTSIYRYKTQHLFLWLEDPVRSLSYGVYDLGPLLSVGKPRLEVGENGEVHILHRSTPDQYIHSVFTMNGTPVSQKFLVSAGSVPTMNRSGEGNVSVSGGDQMDESGDIRIRAFSFED